ncbi:hypothetical protein NY607_19825 [Lysinibacillus sp. A4]|uniref:hypothetical protein n=1 Tax=Lysinibacillus sp. A4 TaxID=2976269 RepID=UPI002175AAFD|nr:hypothetical protein [Lysinibacillus sp. A4]MCS5503361.1 hypothetical protein [Lysinibacillus sp. A4]
MELSIEKDIERVKIFDEIFEGQTYIFIDRVTETIDGTVFSQLESCFVLKYDVAVIALAQVILESELVKLLRENDESPKQYFEKNIDLAWEKELISDQMRQFLHETRQNRNEMLHPNDFKDSRFLDLLAIESLRAVAAFLSFKSDIFYKELEKRIQSY